jgi:hypothetical protein
MIRLIKLRNMNETIIYNILGYFTKTKYMIFFLINRKMKDLFYNLYLIFILTICTVY